MKKLLYSLGLLMIFIGMLTSCESEEIDSTLIYGTWKSSGTQYYRFNSDGTGKKWNPGEDIQEKEAKPFTWTLEGSELTIITPYESGSGVNTVYYTIIELTESTLIYKDYTDKTYSYTKA